MKFRFKLRFNIFNLAEKKLTYRYFIYLGYKGTHYHGWQIQPGASSVQETLNKKISVLLKEEVYIVGAGRTDTGVHAPYYVAHFDSVKPNIEEDKVKFLYHINCLLPKDIAVYDIIKVEQKLHARFSAISRTYMYRICQIKNPFTTEIASYFSRNLDVELMNQAAAILSEYIDFTSFSKLHTDVKTNNCKIETAYWTFENNDLVFFIKADRFLRNMVRAIVGTLLEVGLKKITLDDFRKIIELKDRSQAGTSADACGLHLIYIEYPLENLNKKKNI
jgi:tRNA pseudouridine38-40 synthase